MRSQDGFAVVRPGWVAFLPTGPSQHLGAEMAWAVAGFTTLPTKPRMFDLHALAARGEAAFDARVRELAGPDGVVWTPSQATMAVGKPRTARPIGVTFVAAPTDRVFVDLVESTPRELFAGWSLAPAVVEPVLVQVKVFAFITAFPALFAVICGLIGFFGDEPGALWGIAFWGVFVVVPWAIMIPRWIARRGAGPAPEQARPVDVESLPFAAPGVDAWLAPPPGTSGATSTAGLPATALVARGVTPRRLLALCLEVMVMLIGTLGLGALIERTWGGPASTLAVSIGALLGFFGYQVCTARWLSGTLATRLFGLRLIADDGRLGWSKALMRCLLGWTEVLAFCCCMPFGPVALWLFHRKMGRLPHEHYSKTKTVWA